MKQLLVGAGKAEIIFPEGYFPQHENIGSVYQPMHVRALRIEAEEKGLLLSIELPSLRPFAIIDDLRRKAAEISDVPFENVWLCVTHSLAAPHTPPTTSAKFAVHIKAVEDAVWAASHQAVKNTAPACFGWGRGESRVIVGRDIESVDGWWAGLPGKDPSDFTLSVLRFDDLNGKPLAMIYNHGLKSCVLENTIMTDGFKHAAADLCGMGSTIAEEKYGIPVLFFMGAGGDQYPKKMGHHDELDENGHFRKVDHGEAAYDMLEELGQELGNDLIRTADAIDCCEEAPVFRMDRFEFTTAGKKTYDDRLLGEPPVKNYQYLPAADETVRVELMHIGDTAIIGVKSEVVTSIMQQLKNASPFANTMLFAMVNGGQSYIADDLSFARYSYPALRTMLAQGTDRLFLEKTIAFLEKEAQ